MKKLYKHLVIAGLTLSTLAGSAFSLLHFSINNAYKKQNYTQTLKYIDIARNFTSYYQDIHDDTLFSLPISWSQQEYSWGIDSKSTQYRYIVNTWKYNIKHHKKEISHPTYKQLYTILLEPNHNHPRSLSIPKIRSQYYKSYKSTNIEQKEYTSLQKAIQLADSLPSHEAQRFKAICSAEVMNMYISSFYEVYLTLYPNVLLHTKENFTSQQQPMLHEQVFKTKDHKLQLKTSLANYMQLFTEESEQLLTQLSEKQKYNYSYKVNLRIHKLIKSSEMLIKYGFKNKDATPVMKTLAQLYTLAKDLDNRYSFDKSSYSIAEKKYLEKLTKKNFQKIKKYLNK